MLVKKKSDNDSMCNSITPIITYSLNTFENFCTSNIILLKLFP